MMGTVIRSGARKALWLGALGALAFAGTAMAADAPLTADAVQKNVDDVQNNLNIVWTCITAFLVFFMQPGFALVEAGFTRAKNACNIMMKNLMDFSIGSLAWWAVGFTLMFSGTNWFAGDFSAAFGIDYSGINGLNWTFVIFQCVFAGTAATIVSGAMAERTKFTGYLAYCALICAFVYPISGHWFWNSNGFLAQKGIVDFAGSTVVHSCGGWLALAGAITLGARTGKYGPDGKSKAIQGHNIPLAALGVFILWFGWFGFNPGSTTAANADIGYIAMTTNLAAAAGAVAAMLMSWILFKKPDVSMSLNGVLAGLVGITAGCSTVTFWGSIFIGAVAGALVVLAVIFIDKVLKIDDPVGAVSVHGICGAWGTLALPLVLKEGATASFSVQLQGVFWMFVWAFGCGMVIFNLIKYTIGLRASREEELRGLDIDEHGNEAYPSFQIFSNV